MIYDPNGNYYLIDDREELIQDLRTWNLIHFELYKENVWRLHVRTFSTDIQGKLHHRTIYSSINPSELYKQCEQK